MACADDTKASRFARTEAGIWVADVAALPLVAEVEVVALNA